MKTVSKKLLSLLLVAMLLVSAVPFQAFAADGTVAIDIYEVDLENNAKFVKTVEADPSAYASQDDMVKDIYGQFTKYQYRDGGDGTAMLRVWPLETPEGEKVLKLRIQHNDGTSNYNLVDILEGDGILAAINAAGVKVSREGYKFVGWSLSHTGDVDSFINVYHTAKADMANSDGVIYIYADWEKITDDKNDNDDVVYDVVLKIYTNGKTSSAAKTVSMDNYGIDGKITREEVELCVRKYYKGDLNFFGLFTYETWNGGKYDTDDAKFSIILDPDETNYIYVMVKNATASTSGNADPTNPKTGDYILPAAMTMMLVSGLAAAAVYVFSKKRRV